MSKEEQVLLETINHYNLSNRGLYGDKCVYFGENGTRCAVGRKLNDEQKRIVERYNLNTVELGRLLDEFEAENCLGWFKGVNIYFLDDLQSLHDVESNWDEKGLNLRGCERVYDLIRDHNLSIKGFKPCI